MILQQKSALMWFPWKLAPFLFEPLLANPKFCTIFYAPKFGIKFASHTKYNNFFKK